jgi:hypothetical protein
VMVDGSIRGERLRPLGLCWSAARGRESPIQAASQSMWRASEAPSFEMWP